MAYEEPPPAFLVYAGVKHFTSTPNIVFCPKLCLALRIPKTKTSYAMIKDYTSLPQPSTPPMLLLGAPAFAEASAGKCVYVCVKSMPNYFY